MSKQFENNVDYYIEGERVIFTALAHIKRGQCCGNGCRHCPYTPKHTKGKVVLAEKLLKFKQ
jgi:biotin synthase-like enzyme